MRVISGTARGRKLTPVPGMNTRPTTDRVKTSVFNIIQMRIREAEVLDLFAGTGQLGIECLSRGAKHCDFVDHDKTARATVQRNVTDARVADRSTIHGDEYTAYLRRCRKKYDIIFLDPPYGGEILRNSLELVKEFDILSPDGIIVCESALEDDISVGREYRYGAIRISIVHREEL